MSTDKFKQFTQDALDAIIAHPGSTRMEWFEHTRSNNNYTWHTFKFRVALPLILGGKVKAEGDRFFHISHNTQQ